LFKGIANLATMIKQAQQIGSKLQEINDQLKTQRATGSAGAGMIEAEVNGLGELLRVRIDPQLFGQNDREMIEDLIPAAVNQAIAKSRQLHADAVKSAAGGLNVPGLDEALAEITPSGS
jgi:DNA-binding YbaB/EbfC family protein